MQTGKEFLIRLKITTCDQYSMPVFFFICQIKTTIQWTHGHGPCGFLQRVWESVHASLAEFMYNIHDSVDVERKPMIVEVVENAISWSLSSYSGPVKIIVHYCNNQLQYYISIVLPSSYIITTEHNMVSSWKMLAQKVLLYMSFPYTHLAALQHICCQVTCFWEVVYNMV